MNHATQFALANFLEKSGCIRREGKGFKVTTRKGRVLGHHATRGQAIAQEEAIEHSEARQEGQEKSAIIKQEGSEFVLYSHHGKVLGRHPSREKAVKQEQAIKANGG